MKPKFEPTMTLGNFIQGGTVIALMIAGWYALVAKVDKLSTDQQYMVRTLSATESRAVRMEMYLASRDSRYWATTNAIRVPSDPQLASQPSLLGSVTEGSNGSKIQPADASPSRSSPPPMPAKRSRK